MVMKRHLSTLSILHYVYGAFICLVGLSMLGLVFVGLWLNSPWMQEQMVDGPQPFVGTILSGLGLVLLVVVETLGILNLVSARMIDRRKSRTFSQVVAALNCLSIPFGLALGIFTFVALADPEVSREYGIAD